MATETKKATPAVASIPESKEIRTSIRLNRAMNQIDDSMHDLKKSNPNAPERAELQGLLNGFEAFIKKYPQYAFDPSRLTNYRAERKSKKGQD